MVAFIKDQTLELVAQFGHMNARAFIGGDREWLEVEMGIANDANFAVESLLEPFFPLIHERFERTDNKNRTL